MKLLTITARINAFSILISLLLTAIILFVTLRFLVLDELDEQLALKVKGVEQVLIEGNEVFDPFTEITQLKEPVFYKPDAFADTLVFDSNEAEYEDYRMITAIRTVDGTSYKITTATSRLEWEDFLLVIFGVFLGCSLLLLAGTYIANQRFTKKIWDPFFNNLKQVQAFSLQGQKQLTLEESPVQEFIELNDVLTRMIGKVQRDYRSLKSFSENASHEIQTPLAIILSSLDQLSQSQNLDETSAHRIASAREAATRLSKLNRNLLLLTKIENGQFPIKEDVNLNNERSKHLEMMEELFATKNIHPKFDVDAKLNVTTNPALLDILIGNLMANAYHHSVHGALVKVYNEGRHFVFSNSGEPITKDTEKLFERFYKSSNSENSHGLGLAIVRQICELNQWGIEYQYSENCHHFIVTV